MKFFFREGGLAIDLIASALQYKRTLVLEEEGWVWLLIKDKVSNSYCIF